VLPSGLFELVVELIVAPFPVRWVTDCFPMSDEESSAGMIVVVELRMVPDPVTVLVELAPEAESELLSPSLGEEPEEPSEVVEVTFVSVGLLVSMPLGVEAASINFQVTSEIRPADKSDSSWKAVGVKSRSYMAHPVPSSIRVIEEVNDCTKNYYLHLSAAVTVTDFS
jgi:hypothetical protein